MLQKSWNGGYCFDQSEFPIELHNGPSTLLRRPWSHQQIFGLAEHIPRPTWRNNLLPRRNTYSCRYLEMVAVVMWLAGRTSHLQNEHQSYGEVYEIPYKNCEKSTKTKLIEEYNYVKRNTVMQ